MCGSTDGDRQFHRLPKCIRRTGIGRDILVIYIYRTGNVPIVGRHWVLTQLIAIADIVTVIDNGLRAMDEVTGGFPLHLCCIGTSQA